MRERLDRVAFDPERFVRDLGFTSLLIGADFHEGPTRRVLQVFDREFRTHVVQVKAASKAGTGLYYRVFYNGPRDLTGVAQDAGLLGREPSPGLTLQDEILAACPGSTRAGLDFDASAAEPHVAKIWTFLGPTPAGRLDTLRSVPDSVRAHQDFFARFGLKDFYFVAADYQQQTMNVYFGWEPEHRTREWVRRLAHETGGTALPDDLCDDVLRSMAVSAGVGTTFSWRRPELLRWCLYGLNLPAAEGPATGGHLPRLPDRLIQVHAQAPTLNDSPQVNVGWSFGRAGYYVKLEKSYARDANFLHCAVMEGDFSHPAEREVHPCVTPC